MTRGSTRGRSGRSWIARGDAATAGNGGKWQVMAGGAGGGGWWWWGGDIVRYEVMVGGGEGR